jgi:DNA-binding NarL/FixJ family response regulator
MTEQKESKGRQKPIHVLIVEDEPTLNQAYVTILQAAGGISVDTSFNGQEALDKIAVQQPDVILLDLRMPQMDGIEFLKRFSSVNKPAKTKIIVFSNYDEKEEIDAAFSLGATRYMLKAWASPKELVKLIRETFDR